MKLPLQCGERDNSDGPIRSFFNPAGVFNLAGVPSLARFISLAGVFNPAGVFNLAGVFTLAGVFYLARVPSLARVVSLAGVFNLAGVSNLAGVFSPGPNQRFQALGTLQVLYRHYTIIKDYIPTYFLAVTFTYSSCRIS
jgi:hypothetical protein